jgi:hypothetical protein
MDELSSFFTEPQASQLPETQVPFDESLDAPYHNPSIPDSMDSGYGSSVPQPYPCICNSPYGVPSFPGLDESYGTTHSQTFYSNCDFTVMTGALDSSFPQLPGSIYESALHSDTGKGKGRQDNVGDQLPVLCCVCGGFI